MVSNIYIPEMLHNNLFSKSDDIQQSGEDPEFMSLFLSFILPNNSVKCAIYLACNLLWPGLSKSIQGYLESGS